MYNISIFRFSCLFTNMQITLSVTVPWNWLLKVLRQQDLFHILHRVCLLPLLSRFKIERAGCIDSFVVYLLFYFSHCSTGCKHGVQGPLWHAIHLAPSNILIPAYMSGWANITILEPSDVPEFWVWGSELSTDRREQLIPYPDPPLSLNFGWK